MLSLLPGTTIEADMSKEDVVDGILSPMFLTGGLVLSQVSQITGLEPHAIQNWVKRGFLSTPEHKKYSRRQLCRIMIINMLRGCLQMEKICQLLSHINGSLNDEADDSIDDSTLYAYLVTLVAYADGHRLSGSGEMEGMYDKVLREYREPFAGARERLKRVLRIMVIAYRSGRLQKHAEELMGDLDLA